MNSLKAGSVPAFPVLFVCVFSTWLVLDKLLNGLTVKREKRKKKRKEGWSLGGEIFNKLKKNHRKLEDWEKN